MNWKVFLVGLGGGVLLTAALGVPLYGSLPSSFVEGWFHPPEWLALVLLGVAVLILPATGMAAAFFSDTGAVAGAVAGVIAALIAQICLGAPAAGAWGARDLLIHNLQLADNDIKMNSLLADTANSICRWTYISGWLALVSGLLLGGLGGILAGAVWHSSKASSPQPFSRPVMLAITTTGTWASLLSLLIVTVVSLATLGLNLFDTANLSGAIAILTCFAMLVIWQVLEWWTLLHLHPEIPSTGRSRVVPAAIRGFLSFLLVAVVNGILSILVVVFLFIITTQPFFNYISEQLFYIPFVALLFLILVSGGMSILRGTWLWRHPPAPRGIPATGMNATTSPLTVRSSMLGMVLGGMALLGSTYIGLVAAGFNVLTIIYPYYKALAGYSDLQPTASTVNDNFHTHWSFLIWSAAIILVATILAGVVTWLIQRGKKKPQTEVQTQ